MKVEEKEVDGFRKSARAWVRCPVPGVQIHASLHVEEYTLHKQSSANLTLDYGSYMRNARFEISVIIRRPLQSPHHLHQSLSCSPFPFSPRVLVILHLP